MHDENKTHSASIRVTPRLILGTGILLVGLLFTFDNLGVFDASYVFDYWPVVFIAIGAMKLKEAPRTSAWLSAGLWILVGVTWILYNVGVIDVHPIELWPILLIVAGYMMITRAVKPAKARDDSDDGHKMSAVAALCGVKRQTASKDFRGGDFTAVMGGCEVDLRNAAISNGEAIIDVFAFWGGIDIRVPPTFMVDSQVTPLLGGYDDRTDQRDADPEQRLIVRGIAMMGGVDVRN